MSGNNPDKLQQVGKICTDLTFGTWRKQDGWSPLTVSSAEGSHFTDSNGKSYLDFSSQLMCSNLGHGNRKIREAISNQLDKFEYVQPGYASAISSTSFSLVISLILCKYPSGGMITPLVPVTGSTIMPPMFPSFLIRYWL